MKKVLIGSGSKGKRKFLERFFAELPVSFCSPQDLGVEIDVVESGRTPEDNARIKAREYFAVARVPTLATDAGLTIEGLPDEDQPGVYVRRIARVGEASDNTILEHFSSLVKGLGGRTEAKWAIGFALCWSEGEMVSKTFTRKTILTSKRVSTLNPGVPLNSMQMDPESGKYLAEMDPRETREFYRRKMGFFEFLETHLGKLP